MAVSKEVQAAVDKVREMKDYIRADKEADKIRDKQLSDAKSAQRDAEDKLAALQSKLDGLQVDRELSQEDKDALQAAFADAQDAQTAASDAQANTQEVHDALKKAVPANADAPQSGGGASNGSGPAPADATDVQKPDPINRSVDDERPPVPLMPTMAFDPDPSGASRVGGNDGQPSQAAAIETPGGFVVAGGGSTHRAPGSSPESPSSSQIVPLDPDAVAPASTADLVKSGLGDSSQNALKGPDGQPIEAGPGMPREPSDAEREAAEQQAALAAKERERREENPLNLAPADTPQAGTPEADKAGRERALEAQREAQEQAKAEKDRNSEQKGVEDDGSGKQTDAFADEKPKQDAPAG